MNINKLINSLSISQYQLSKLSKVPYSTISDLCTGKTDILKCNVYTALQIAKALNCSIESLLDEEIETQIEDKFISIQEYYENYLRNKRNVILYGLCALDYLGLINNGIPIQIEVYATNLLNENYKIHKVNNFKQIEYEVINNILVSTINQAINDIIKNKKINDETIYEVLFNYKTKYKSFDELKISKSNINRYNKIISDIA